MKDLNYKLMELKAFKDRVFDPTEPVEVYRNLHLKGRVYSIRQKGKVIGHTSNINLIHCKFIVGQKSRERAVRAAGRNVHAWIKGYVDETNVPFVKHKRVGYNPFKHTSFVDIFNAPVTESELVKIIEGDVLVNVKLD